MKREREREVVIPSIPIYNTHRRHRLRYLILNYKILSKISSLQFKGIRTKTEK